VVGRDLSGHGRGVAANPSIGWRLLGTLSAVLAGVAARKLMVKAIPYAIASGAAMGLARMLATRKAAGYYRKSTGHLPPGMEEVT
jgi:hypothetical protein